MNEIIHQAADIIQKGGLVAFPTETVYGLGADAFNALAVARIFEVKNRPKFDPIIVHIDHMDWLKKICHSVDQRVYQLAEKFWPGPLTMIFAKQACIPDIVTAGLKTVAIRWPAHPMAQKLIQLSKTPIAAPSANPFEYLSPTTAEHVRKQIGHKIDFILDGGPCQIGLESTILDLSESVPVVLRPGGLSVEEIKKVIGTVQVSGLDQSIKAPGQFHKHYSPRTPLKLMDQWDEIKDFLEPNKKFGLLTLKGTDAISQYFSKIEILSRNGNMQEAAANLFAALHRLDQAGLDLIFAEKVPESGLGVAIMNRLHKAAH